MKWLLFTQTPYDSINFITDELDSVKYLPYYEFKKYLSSFKIENRIEIINALDKFETIFLDIKTGTWEIKKREINENISFEELYELNKKEEKKTKINKAKNIINTFKKEK